MKEYTDLSLEGQWLGSPAEPVQNQYRESMDTREPPPPERLNSSAAQTPLRELWKKQSAAFHTETRLASSEPC